MAAKNRIEILLSARDANLTTSLQRGQRAIQAFNKEALGGTGALSSMRAQVLQLAGAFAGLSAIGQVATMLKTADQNAFALAASIKAANREFEVGSAADWEQTIATLSARLRVYSESDIRGATARTIDMTKRLGLNAAQMERVISLSADLSAGRTDLEGGVERVTAALRGEAEAAEFLGLTLNETYVKGWYEARGAMQGAWKDLDDLQKAQIRYQIFLEQAIPLQGKAAESINTWSGALQYAQATVADNIATNEDLVASLKGVADILRDNGPAIGQFVGALATGAARAIEFAAQNREVLGAVVKYGAIFGAAAFAIGRLAAVWRGLNAAMVVMTGLRVVPWLQAAGTAAMGAVPGVVTLTAKFGALAAGAAGFFAAYKAGEWLTMRESIKGVSEEQAGLARNTARLSQASKEAGLGFDLAAASINELSRLEKEGKIHYDELTQTWVEGSKKQAAASSQTAETMRQATGAALEEMKKKYQEYANEVRRLQGEIVGRERSLAAELRALSRTGMSDVSAWQDQKREAEEYAEAAKRTAAEAEAALQAGDTITAGEKWKEAVGYADEAKNAYKALNTEVKSGDQVIISQQQGLRTAMEGVKEAGELGIDILKRQQEAAKGMMDDLVGKSGFADLTANMNEAEQVWLKNWQNMEREAEGHIATVSRRLDALVEDRHVTVWVTEKIKRAMGGPVGFARGGRLPGYGGGDRISALLEAGEFVIRKEAVSKFGAGLFHALNSLRLPEIPRFAAGGMVGAGDAVNINLSLAGNTYPLSGSRTTAEQIQRDLARAHRLRSR